MMMIFLMIQNTFKVLASFSLFSLSIFFPVPGGTVVAQPSSPVVEMAPLLQNLKCHGVGIVATLYPCTSERTSAGSDECKSEERERER